MIIRKMCLDDYSAVYALWMSCSGMGLNNHDDSEAGVGRFLSRNPDTCFVAEDETIVGVILAGNDGKRGYIYHLSVCPTHRRQGIASALVHRAVDALSEQGIAKAALVTFSRNEEGNAFWEKQGFTVRNDLTYRNKALMPMIRFDT